LKGKPSGKFTLAIITVSYSTGASDIKKETRFILGTVLATADDAVVEYASNHLSCATLRKSVWQ